MHSRIANPLFPWRGLCIYLRVIKFCTILCNTIVFALTKFRSINTLKVQNPFNIPSNKRGVSSFSTKQNKFIYCHVNLQETREVNSLRKD
jgi:hypothetical protein